MTQTSPDIVCMGEPMAEFSRVDGADGRPVYLPGFGGDTSNCAIAAARQGASVGYVTRLGADAFGDALVGLWRDEGIESSAVGRDPAAPTAAYFIEPTAAGRRFVYYRTGSAASRMGPADLPALFSSLRRTAVADQRPLKTGLRFSRSALMPSWWSSVMLDFDSSDSE